MSLKIAVDLDDTLGNFTEAFLPYFNEKTGSSYRFEDIFDYEYTIVTGEDPETIKRVFHDFFLTDTFNNLPLVSGALDGIAELKKHHELYIITGRPTYLREATEKWIEQNFPNTFSEIFITNTFSKILNDKRAKKSEYCLQTGAEILIDDLTKFADECSGEGINVLLLDYPWNQQVLNENIFRMKSWAQIVKKVNELALEKTAK